MMKKYNHLLLFLLVLLSYSVSGQQSCWAVIENSANAQKQLQNPSRTINNYSSYRLDEQVLRSLLKNVPQREIYGAKRAQQLVDFPNALGTISSYEIVSLNTLSDGLAAKYPNLKTFRGIDIQNPLNTIRIAMNGSGIHTVLFDSQKGIYNLEQLSNTDEYILYEKQASSKFKKQFSCKTENHSHGEKPVNSAQKRIINDGKLRTFRMAIATTGEYSQFHINRANLDLGTDAQKKEAVLSAVMTTMMTINELFENEFSITMQLIPDMDNIIFLDSETDDLENFDPFALIDDSQRVIDANIGIENYDIGHTFSTGAGGLAQIGSPCTNFRAQGVTGISSPVGPEFDLDFVAHEIGHQFGGNHTQNNDQERVASTSVEPGSGSTIMGYAGISPPNIQDDSDPYFNAVNIREVWNFLRNVSPGGNCGVVETNTNNSAPTIGNIADSYTIPHSTPFVLDVAAADADNDALTYSWEQQDTTPATMPPVATSAQGPMFRSLIPTTASERFFPPYPQILAGELKTEWQVVPTVARQLNFTLTVRDNNPVGGQNALKDVVVNVANSGPFRILSQNEQGISYNRNEIVTIEWDVAGTTDNGINTERVDILLSYDGGQNFTEELITNTRNDGRERIAIPTTDFSPTCRIKIVPTNNIYFAINTQEFAINETIVTERESTGTILISPNPTNTGVFTIDFGQRIAVDKTVIVEVFDLTGKLVFADEYTDTFDALVDITANSFGLYIVRVIRGNEIITRKVYSKLQ